MHEHVSASSDTKSILYYIPRSQDLMFKWLPQPSLMLRFHTNGMEPCLEAVPCASAQSTSCHSLILLWSISV